MTTSSFAAPPEPPYYSVIFSSQRTPHDDGYGQAAERMVELASAHRGYLGAESVRGADGFGITVSYWTDLEAIAVWKANGEHRIAQETGKTEWYDHYTVRIARVERAYQKLSSL